MCLNFWKGKLCPVCRKQFTENDDIVYCPECGTAHHRECWNSAGGCFFAEEHKKGNYDTTNVVAAAPKAAEEKPQGSKSCPECGAACRADLRVCLHCGHEFDSEQPQAVPPHPESAEHPNAYPPPPGSARNTGFPPFGFPGFENAQPEQPDTSEVIADGVTVSEAARFCGPDGVKYAENFKAVRDHKTPFSAAGFFGSFFWLLYRKMLVPGLIVAGVVFSPIIASVILIFVNYRDPLVAALTDPNGTALLYSIFDQARLELPVLSYLTIAFWVVLLLAMLFCGLFGNRLYCKKALNDIATIKKNVPGGFERSFYYARRGGISMIYPFLSVFVFYGLLNLLMFFLI